MFSQVLLQNSLTSTTATLMPKQEPAKIEMKTMPPSYLKKSSLFKFRHRQENLTSGECEVLANKIQYAIAQIDREIAAHTSDAPLYDKVLYRTLGWGTAALGETASIKLLMSTGCTEYHHIPLMLLAIFSPIIGFLAESELLLIRASTIQTYSDLPLATKNEIKGTLKGLDIYATEKTSIDELLNNLKNALVKVNGFKAILLEKEKYDGIENYFAKP